MKSSYLLILALVLMGCATAGKISSVQIGMTKGEVISVMGRPASISAKDGTEYLNYSLSETSDQAFYGITRAYFVRLINGIVDSYGRLGDFDSTQKPTVKIETDENIKSTSETPKKIDLYTELQKLKQLKEEGLITPQEYEREKKELLEKH
ncbi:MAG: SHOCT domain-containing protein [Elusimicrobia bacterium]|nr:SHOCT domain-containing protein [Elusimicrobiota bacterium]MBK8651148.1 SHOCT domain-containing protein [Elusimicrobiota bacterium]